MASYWSRRFRKSSGTIITVTIIGALICFAMAHLILMANDEEEDVNRRRREQVLVCTVLSLVPKIDQHTQTFFGQNVHGWYVCR